MHMVLPYIHFHPLLFPDIAHVCLCLRNSWIMDSRIESIQLNSMRFDSTPLKMDNGHVQFHWTVILRIHWSAHCFTAVMILTRTAYIRLLLDLLFGIFGLCTGNIFVNVAYCVSECVRAFFLLHSDAFVCKWLYEREFLKINPEMGKMNEI